MILHSPDSEYAKEMTKWEALPSQLGEGQRPYVYHEYPKMLYRAGRTPAGVPAIVDSHVVESATQEANLRSRGFHPGQDVALAALHAADQEAAQLAANRAFTDRRMSPAAQAEAAALDAQSTSHLPVLPERPRKPGRPKKEAPHAN